MKTFHGKQSVKDKYINRIKDHMKADAIIQGTGYEDGKGCAVGCTLENYDHSLYPKELGLPEWLGKLEDAIFEGLKVEESKTFPLEFLESIPVGVDEAELENLKHDLAIQRLSILLSQQKELFPDDRFGVNKALEITIQYHENPSFRSADAAARYATRSADFAADSTSRSDRYATRSADYAARSAAESTGSTRFVTWPSVCFTDFGEHTDANSAAEAAESIEAAWAARLSTWTSSYSDVWIGSAHNADEAWSKEKERLIKALKQLKTQ